jgi:hypothetical protein
VFKGGLVEAYGATAVGASEAKGGRIVLTDWSTVKVGPMPQNRYSAGDLDRMGQIGSNPVALREPSS